MPPAPPAIDDAPTAGGLPARPRAWTGTRAHAIAALVLLALYLATRTRAHLWDSIAYVARVIDDPLLSEKFLSTRLFHPHHLLYVPLGKLMQALLGPFGLAQDPFFPLQALGALSGAGTAWLFGSMLLRRTGNGALALIALLLLGCSNAFWQYSTGVEVMLPALFLATLSAWFLTSGRSTRAIVLAGLMGGAATLLHQIVALPVAATALALALSAPGAGEISGRRHRDAWIYVTVAGALSAATYLGVALLHEGLRSPGEVLEWLFAAGSRSAFDELSLGTTVDRSWHAFLGSIVALAAHGPRAWTPGLGTTSGMIALLLLTVVLVASVGPLLRGVRRREQLALGLSVAFLSLAAFIVWFEPGNQNYWVYVIPLVWGCASAFLPARLAAGRISHALAALFVVALATCNFDTAIRPRRDSDQAPYRHLLRVADEHFAAGDVIVTPAALLKQGRIALPFFCQVEVLEIPAPGEPAAGAAFRERLGSRIDGARRGAGRVLATQGALARMREATPRGTEFVRLTGKGPRTFFAVVLPPDGSDG